MNSRDLMDDFFRAENARDWEAYAQFLADDVEWVVISPGRTKTITGKAAYLAAIQAAYAAEDVTFAVLRIESDDSGRLVATLLQSESGDLSLDVFDWSDGLIVREWEFLLGAQA